MYYFKTVMQRQTMHWVLLALFLALLSNTHVSAQVPGTLDVSFNTAENSPTSGLRALNVHSILEQPDGKILVGGRFSSLNGKPANGLIRLNADFTIDQSFQVDESNSGEVLTIVLLPDGKILIGGTFQSYGGSSNNYMARLLPSGLPDDTFSQSPGFNDAVQSIVVQSNGKMIVGGRFSKFQDITVNFAARLNADGSLDTSFNTDGLFNGRVKSILLQNDKYIVAGWFTNCREATVGYIARLNSDGSCDLSFASGSGANNVIETITYDRQGRLLVGGTFTTFNGATADRLTRLQADGSIDGPFQTSTLLNGEIYRMEVLNDDSIVIVGGFSVYNGAATNYVIRIDADGALIPFANIGTGSTNKIFSLDVLSNGNIAVGGEFYMFDGNNANRVALLDSNGAMIESLTHNSGANNYVYALNWMPNGKILVGGKFTHYNGTLIRGLMRLNSDGSLDDTFSIGAGFDGDVYGITVQPDGKLLIAGGFTQLDNESFRRLARLMPDGSIDPTFQIGNAFNLPVYETVVQPDGKIIVAGFFTSFRNQVRGRIIRLNTDGSEDTGFDLGVGFDSYVRSIRLLPDGKILAVGNFSTYQGQPYGRIIRLLPDGSIDTSFNPGLGANGIIESCILLDDGRILLGGTFTSYDNTPRNGIARIHPNGSLDATFQIGNGFSGDVREIQQDSRGRIVVVGGIRQFNGKTVSNIARLHPDGSHDTEYFASSTADGFVHTLAIQSNDNVIIGGGFNRIGSDFRAGVTRLLAGIPTSIDDGDTIPTLPAMFSIEPNYPNPFNPSTTLRVNLPQTAAVSVTVYDLTGRVVMQLPARSLQAGRHSITLDASNLSTGVYIYRVSTGNWFASGKMTLVK